MIAKQIVTNFANGSPKTQNIPLTVKKDEKQQELYLLNIYPRVRYQEIQSFGGAITDAVAATLEKMPDAISKEVINAYFGPEGIGYRSIRTHIDSCDFATEPYVAMNDPEDENFDAFSLARIENKIIYWIKEAYKAAAERLPVVVTMVTACIYENKRKQNQWGAFEEGMLLLLGKVYLSLYSRIQSTRNQRDRIKYPE